MSLDAFITPAFPAVKYALMYNRLQKRYKIKTLILIIPYQMIQKMT